MTTIKKLDFPTDMSSFNMLEVFSIYSTIKHIYLYATTVPKSPNFNPLSEELSMAGIFKQNLKIKIPSFNVWPPKLTIFVCGM